MNGVESTLLYRQHCRSCPSREGQICTLHDAYIAMSVMRLCEEMRAEAEAAREREKEGAE